MNKINKPLAKLTKKKKAEINNAENKKEGTYKCSLKRKVLFVNFTEMDKFLEKYKCTG